MMIPNYPRLIISLQLLLGTTITLVAATMKNDNSTSSSVFHVMDRVVVTDQAMGARCAVAADFDNDGRQDLVSASSNDNAVSWYRNEGNDENGHPMFSIKRQITWSSLGSRIVTVADINGDGHVDVIGASYYDSSLRWFENDGTGEFTPHVISDAVNEGQGVTVADIDNDGDADIITASSGDNTIAVYRNIDHGIFCEIKEVVDDNAVGARTVVAADLNGDGWPDLASTSKDDNTIAWYPNDGTGHFPTKLIISAGDESLGAYSLVAVDIDDDGDNDLVVASNGNDHVSLWRNDGNGNFEKTLIFDNADFVLSVTAVDFDRDGDLDVASASFFDGYINWYENVDGKGYEWKNHTVFVGMQGHYVSFADMDGDGDDDLIGVTHADNTVAVFLARTGCDMNPGDNSTHHHKQECCHVGTEWNGSFCEPCRNGTFGIGAGEEARCEKCPTDACRIPEYNVMPATCSGYTGCVDVLASIAQCSCPADTMKDPFTDACVACPEGQIRPDKSLRLQRGPETVGNYTEWEMKQGVCFVPETTDYTLVIVIAAFVGVVVLAGLGYIWNRQNAQAKADAMWTIQKNEITYDEPIQILGSGSFGEVVKGYYRGTEVAVKRVFISSKGSEASKTKNMRASINKGTSSTRSNSSSLDHMAVPDNMAELFPGFARSTNKSTFSSKGIRKAFIEEMRIISKLRHPCITTVMGAVMHAGDEPRLVMEYMERGSLRDLLGNQTFPLDPEQTLPLIRDIMQGLRFLHSANPPICHGDLKSANVLVDANFRAKICDFGFAQRWDAQVRVGTPFWMAPELLRGERISTQSDVYAFGVLLWEVMTHRLPYDNVDYSYAEILQMVSRGELRPDCDHRGLDREMIDCMQECWAQDPSHRPSLEDLEIKLIPLCGQNLFSVMHERHTFANKQSTLLQDVFPEHIAKDLLAGKKVEPEHHDCVSIFFSDIKEFTTISSTLRPEEVSDLLDRLYIQFDGLAEKHGVFKLETIGDAWVGVTNLNNKNPADHAARIARFALDAVRAAQKTRIHPLKPQMGHVAIRIGIHVGPVVSSVVGTRNPRYCLFGDAMNTASRMESTSEAQRIQCSEDVVRLARKQDKSLRFSYRGKTKVKGKGEMKTFWVNNTTTSSDDSISSAHGDVYLKNSNHTDTILDLDFDDVEGETEDPSSEDSDHSPPPQRLGLLEFFENEIEV